MNLQLGNPGAISEDWYTETELSEQTAFFVSRQSYLAEAIVDNLASYVGGEDEDVEDNIMGLPDGGLDKAALLAREKTRAKRKLEKERVNAAKQTLTRDWSTTIKNWNSLTRDEVEVLALDPDVLK
ncbi:hypothetical protein PHMEG_00014761 [Phytophthora megakarya]|uniref:Uncharacterized protein n=1 Tax=Phytophthora megakarya TaxID=4795 RepID=A0A225W416_9STRA|nr:hypothetical protein PHMEG_00014761 [Phytophthora megakarya]